MGLFDGIRNQLIDVIEWLDSSRDTVVWRYPRNDNEIKNGAKLTVRESQAAVFVNEGQIADAFGPGMYELTTQNLPILSDLKGWKYGFQSPFRAEVYFVNMRRFTDLKWGTQNPIIMRDPDLGTVRVRAFGGYALQVVDPPKLLRELVGTDPHFQTDKASEHIRQMIVARLSKALTTAGVGVLDLATRQSEIGNSVAAVLSEDLSPYGFNIPSFFIENISVPKEVEEALDARSRMGALGNLDNYMKMQTADAIEKAAENPSGTVGDGMGMGMGVGMGMGMGMGMAGAMQPGTQGGSGAGQGSAPQDAPPHNTAAQGAPPAAPPPLPQPELWYAGVNGQQLGPMDKTQLMGALSSGQYPQDTLVWKAGMAGWLPARDVADLRDPMQPPALPPQ
ncbi:Membrane protease subunit, stomatin/prohibitin family, contains C-terminal Zn-ribbon domain [Austwickia chelonae]|uniref:Antifreeze protein n=1 Tax=Austwickia chelonae NBRC 105200 TaxID=1184607 RepID=K6VVW6_9MICO|nr:SPFH domain-containing protein [Austwickia chelonae]GAB79475.1 hypothetical protein AUCHE_27_00050 [Austwickia chelonae NBRC 105200]SEW38491.1 Membrane protease subunit, stomatin/prohibitin family, contains C-terminal Zn-ribbon domain [Austwickia chelonae]